MIAQKPEYSQLSFRFIRLKILGKTEGKIMTFPEQLPQKPQALEDKPIPWTRAGGCEVIE